MEIKAIVVAESFSQFATYIRNRHYVREQYGFYVHPDQCNHLEKDTPVYWLEGWSDNPNINNTDVAFLKTFTKHKQISERTIQNEGFSF